MLNRYGKKSALKYFPGCRNLYWCYFVPLLFLVSLLSLFLLSCSKENFGEGNFSPELINRAEAVLNPEGLSDSLSDNGGSLWEDKSSALKLETLAEDPEGIPLELTVFPADSRIIINGKWVGQGLLRGRFSEGSVLYAEFVREGFLGQSMSITVTEGMTDFRVELEPHPVIRRISVPPGEGMGNLIAVDWGVIVYVNVKGDLISVNLETGEVEERELSNFVEWNRDSTSGFSLGRYITPYGSMFVLPEDNAVSLIDPKLIGKKKSASGKELGEGKLWSYPLKAGSRMSAAIWNGKAVIADRIGRIHLISLDNGERDGLISTGSFEPRRFAPTLFNDRAVIAGRGGVVSVVDPSTLELIKEIRTGSPVEEAPVAGPSGIYIYTNNSIYGYTWADDNFFYRIERVSAPPALFRGRLYFGNLEGRFFVADAATGRIIKSTTLGTEVECRPMVLPGNRIAVKTFGEILIVNSEGMVE